MSTAASPNAEQVSEQRTDTFARLAEPLRRELKVHCYRMLGSLHEAEDAVQDAYVRAWRNFGSFDGHGSFRSWLYKIATNVCLDVLADRKRTARLLPDQHAAPTTAMPDGAPAPDVAWLEPYPGVELEGLADDAPSPEARYSSRQATTLAFVAVIQQLPPRQRAVLLLGDVLGWSAAEIATLLGGTVASINSALQRARDTLAKHDIGAETADPNAAQKVLLGRYLQAWEALDLESFAAVLKEDARYTMPPLPQWYAGRAAIRAFFAWAWKPYAGYRLVPTNANGQPAFAAYSRFAADEPWTAHSLHVLSLDGDGVSGITLFAKPLAPRLFAAFGLPLTFEGEPAAGPSESRRSPGD